MHNLVRLQEGIIFLENLNIILVAIFALENFLMLFALGCAKFLHDPMNLWDTFVVCFSILEFIFMEKTSESASLSLSSVFRILRILRIFKLIRSWKKFRIMILSIILATKRMINYIFLVMNNFF